MNGSNATFCTPPAGAFANPPTATEGAHLPNPRPLCPVTSAGKEILYLSSEESIGSSNGELSSWSNIFAGVLRDLGIDPEEKKKKPNKKKKKKKPRNCWCNRATAGASDKGTHRFRQSNLDDYVVASDSLEGLSRIGEKKTSVAGSKSLGSAGSRNPEVGATHSSIALDEEEEEEQEEEPALKLVSWKRSRDETVAGVKAVQKAEGVPVIGKQSKLRSLYKFSPEAQKNVPKKTKGVEIMDPKEPAPKKTKFIIKHPQTIEGTVEKVFGKEIEKENEKDKEKKKAFEKPVVDKSKETETAATAAQEKRQGPEVVHITGLDQPLHEKEKEATREKGPEVVKPTEPMQVDAPTQTMQVTSAIGGSAAAVYKETTTVVGGVGAGVNVRSSAFAARQAGAASQSSMSHPPIGPKDTLGDIYYKTYTKEARGDAPHHHPWGLKQKDTFMEFAPCRDWFLNSFLPGEVNRQSANPRRVVPCLRC
ncbi:hypothetical protein Hanom_Chr07g00633401 [Helianthus anomalus]